MSELIYQALFCFVIIAMYAIQAIYLIAMAVPIVLYLLIALAAAAYTRMRSGSRWKASAIFLGFIVLPILFGCMSLYELRAECLQAGNQAFFSQVSPQSALSFGPDETVQLNTAGFKAIGEEDMGRIGIRYIERPFRDAEGNVALKINIDGKREISPFFLSQYEYTTAVEKRSFLPVFRVSHRIVNKSSAERTAEAVDVLLGGGFIGRYIEIFYDRAYVSCGYVDDSIGAWRPNDKWDKERHHAYHEADIKFLSRALGHER